MTPSIPPQHNLRKKADAARTEEDAGWQQAQNMKLSFLDAHV